MTSIDAGGWAENAGILTGHILLSVNDIPATTFPKDELVEMLNSVRPLAMTFALEHASPKISAADDVLIAVAEPGTTRLGFQPDCLPPASRILVKSIDAGGWAESAGILPGHMLVSVNDTPVTKLQQNAFIEMMKSVRPLAMNFVTSIHTSVTSEVPLTSQATPDTCDGESMAQENTFSPAIPTVSGLLLRTGFRV